MEPFTEDILIRAREYATKYRLFLDRRLGFGKDGIVWETDAFSALKVFRLRERYARETSVYRRLAERHVVNVAGHRVPQLVRADDALALEMTIVRPPFVLDFASAYLDGSAPVFPEDVLAEWLAEKQEEFGERWPQARAVLAGLRSHGVQMTDVHPGNIAFAET
jgi:hypothetical protein